MNKGILGFVLGSLFGTVASIVVVLMLMASGTETVTVPYRVDGVAGDTWFRTPRFTVIFRATPFDGAASSAMAIAGRDGSIPAYWRGYPLNSSASGHLIDAHCAYDRSIGRATVFVAGRLFYVEDEGTNLCFDGVHKVKLSTSPSLVIVEKDGSVKVMQNSGGDSLVEVPASSPAP